MPDTIHLLAFDADDTLWVNEPHYRAAEETLIDILRPHVPDEDLSARLYEREMHNLKLFGYGAKAFMLSMIETAIELTGGCVGGTEIQRLIDTGKAMLTRPVQVYPHVEATLEALSRTYRLMIITKGDLFDQESKIARSGLSGYFDAVEIVSEKDEATYARILRRQGVQPAHFVMVGNSLRSDILPVLGIGGHAIHIPAEQTWAHEQVHDLGPHDGRIPRLDHIGQLPALLGDPTWRVGLKASLPAR